LDISIKLMGICTMPIVIRRNNIIAFLDIFITKREEGIGVHPTPSLLSTSITV